MPKVPVDYSNTCIYKLVHFDDLNDENIYIGHTTNMTKRRWQHKNGCYNPNRKHYNIKIYEFIRENGGWDNWQMILVEKYPCNNVYEAIARERYWKRELKATLNTLEPGRTRKEYREDYKEKIAEYNKEYYEINKQQVAEQQKQYRKKNKEHKSNYDKERYNNLKEQIKKYVREKITCECGSVICRDIISKHRKTIKHQEWLKNNNLCTN